jgi:uncharacterized protein
MIAAHLRGASLDMGTACAVACTIRRLAEWNTRGKRLVDNSLYHRAESDSRRGRRESEPDWRWHAGRVRSPELFRSILFAFAIFLSFQCFAAETIPPKPARYFNDYASVVSPSAALRFNEQLAQFERETSNQIVVAVWRTMPSQSSIDDFTQRTFQAWQLGQKGRNNGAVFFVFVDDHRMRIQTGYGLEGALPDITCNEIIRNAVAPRFRANDFEGGFAAGIDLIFKAVRGEYTGTGKTVHESKSGDKGSTAGLLVFFLVLIVFLLAMRASRRFGGYRYSGVGGPFVSGNWGSGWSGGGGGGWSSGGGSGFSGFSGGGGSSGGGGASGSW